MNSKPNQPSATTPPALTATDLKALADTLPGWTIGADALEKHWRLDDFSQAMQLANAVAELAERLNHHPDLHIGWGRCSVLWTTHDAGGVTALDVDAARQTEALAASLGARPQATDESRA